MYLREMGTVPLLTREGEVEIAKRIERGKKAVHARRSRARPWPRRKWRAWPSGWPRASSTVRDVVIFNEEEVTEEKLEAKIKRDPEARSSKVAEAHHEYLKLPREVRRDRQARAASYVKAKWKLGRLRVARVAVPSSASSSRSR